MPPELPGNSQEATRALLQLLQQRDAARQEETRRLKEATRARILALLGTDPNTASITDPDLAPQAEAFRGASRRGVADTRAALAERAAFTGLNLGGQGSGAFDTDVQSLGENAGFQEAGYNANLVGQKLEQRRGTLLQGLQLAQAMGATEEAQSIETQLASLDAELRQTGLETQSNLGRGQLGLGVLSQMLQQQRAGGELGLGYADLRERGLLGRGQLGLGALGLTLQDQRAARELGLSYADLRERGLLGRGQLGAGLVGQTLQNQRFYDQLGFSYADLEARANREAFLSLMR